MRGLAIVCVLACACGGENPQVQAAAPQPLPTVEQPPPPPPPPPPPRPVVHADHADTTVTVNFVEIRKHPSSAKLDAILRSAPAYRAFPSVDPVRDLDWLVWHGEDLVVHYALTDEQVDKAIERVAPAFDVHVAGVRAWKGHVTYGETVFLRTAPHLLVIVPSGHADVAARELARRAPQTPTFEPNELARLKLVPPSAAAPGVPEDISEARIRIDAAPSGGADIRGEGDCPTEAAARADAVALEQLIQQKNNFGVRIMTQGLLNHVELTPSGTHVQIHIAASAAQVDAVLALAQQMYAANTP